MQAALDAALAHVRQREQFGGPVGAFQAVQHLAADAHVSLEAARSCAWYGLWAVDALAPAEALLAARTAKAAGSEYGREVCEAQIQLLGGVGMTWEYPAHLHLRRALVSRQTLGDEHAQYDAIAQARLGAAGS
jgi:alkylation response protein AidB-like acyl-CoA dehydrogenase